MALGGLLAPLDADRFGFTQARHLLSRAGFGGPRGQVLALRDMGLRKAVEFLVDYDDIDVGSLAVFKPDPDILRRPTPQREMMRRARRDNDPQIRDRLRAERRLRMAEDHQQMAALTRWWVARMIATPRPLEEKLVLLWHSHFATSYRTVRNSYLMYKQNAFFRKHAKGNFADLAGGIIHDPAMIRFLDNHHNHKQKPNENLARELMELFTLGEGNYTENDVKQGAAALTGYTLQDNDFHFNHRRHDDGVKTILGQTGRFDGDDFARIILEQDSCATFVCNKLYKWFVADADQVVSPAAKTVIAEMADQLRAEDYRLVPVLKTLFASEHFYDPHIVGNKIKGPVELVAGAIRTLQTPIRDLSLVVDAAASMGQQLFAPPSVAGWPGGRSWINTSTLFVRQNLTTYLLTGRLPFANGWDRGQIDYAPMFLLEDLPQRTSGAVVDHLMTTLLPPRMAPRQVRQLTDFLDQRGGDLNDDRLIGLLLLMTAMPEYQLC